MNNEQQRILEVLKFAISFFEEHHLRYVACAGTVLGAVRHGGFIPWDDDIDIYMPREDYNKLLALSDKVKEAGYNVVSLKDKGYYLPFSKITDTSSTIWECKEMPFVFGFYVDVFPLDSTSESDETIFGWQKRTAELLSKYRISVCHYTLCDFVRSLLRRDKYHCIEQVKSWFWRPVSGKYLADFQRFEQKYSGGKGEKCLCVTQEHGKIFQTSWFDNPVELDFEGIKLKVPNHYDEYLTLLYGNYHELPPVEKRHSDHQRFYLDSNRLLTVSQVRKMLKNG